LGAAVACTAAVVGVAVGAAVVGVFAGFVGVAVAGADVAVEVADGVTVAVADAVAVAAAVGVLVGSVVSPPPGITGVLGSAVGGTGVFVASEPGPVSVAVAATWVLVGPVLVGPACAFATFANPPVESMLACERSPATPSPTPPSRSRVAAARMDLI